MRTRALCDRQGRYNSMELLLTRGRQPRRGRNYRGSGKTTAVRTSMTKLKTPVGPEDHSLGPEEAPITLLEYGDYQCPHCGHAYPIVKAVQEKLGNRLRFVFRNFPL